MTIDWTEKLRHLLQTMAFCLAVATVQYGFQPGKPYGPSVVFSLFIGTIIWAVVDLGRHAFASSAKTGWPQGLAGPGLVMGAIATGYLAGSALAARLCIYYGWLPAGASAFGSGQWRTTVLVTALAGVLGTFYFHSKGKSEYLKRKMGEATRHASEARLKLLESQLEPHMLFNTLANLRALIGTDPQRAQRMLDHMIDYLRATLSGSRTATHTARAEFDRLRDYLELMTMRMGPRLDYSLQLPSELERHPVPALLLQPLVENSIQHGLEPKVGGGRIIVSARRENAHLVLEVADTGVGPSSSPGPGKGFGMSQVRERLATLHGDAASVDFAGQLGTGSRTLLRLPFQP